MSLDALNTKKEIEKKIINAGADDTLALKRHHKNLNEHVSFLCNTTNMNEKNHHQDVEKSHGSITTREYSIIPIHENNVEALNQWKGLQAVGLVRSVVFKNKKKTEESRYYLLSHTDIKRFAHSARGHWGIEHTLHGSLDVIVDEDGSRKRKDHALRNDSLIRKFALNSLRTQKGQLSVPLAQIKACTHIDFLHEVPCFIRPRS